MASSDALALISVGIGALDIESTGWILGLLEQVDGHTVGFSTV